MDLHGVDVFIQSPRTPSLPERFGTLKLVLITNRGTRVYPPPAPDIAPDDLPRCRYVSETPVTDDDIDQLAAHLTSQGWRWSKCQKLFRKDGIDQFSQAY
jgi:hypothetical protein